MKTRDKSWVLITGASSGFGEEFARQYAGQGHSLVLVARRLDRLQRLAEELRRQFSVEVVVEQVDLADISAVIQLHRRLCERGVAINILINNAGHGLQGAFIESKLDAALAMVHLDIASLTAVTHLFAQDMRERGRGKILLVASLLAFQGVVNFAVYSAAKAYVLRLGEALHREFKRDGITVTTLCPGMSDTGFAAVAKQEVTAGLKLLMMQPAPVVRAGIRALDAGRISVVPGLANKFLALFMWATPRWLHQAMFARVMNAQTTTPTMNTPITEHPTVNAHRKSPTPQKTSEPANAVVADEVSFVKSNRRSLMAIGLVAGGLTAALMAGWSSKPDVKDPRLQSPRVEIFETKAAGANGRTFTGIVEARVQSDLGFRVGGKILERSVNMGQRVQKGQILMRLDSVDLKLSFAAQQANVEAARAKYTQAKADEARYAALVKTGAVSRQEYDQARAALDSAKAQLDAAEAQARVSDNSSEYAALLADADGVIVRTLSEPGQVVAAGQTVIQLAHDGPREALINLPEGVRPDLGTTASARLYGRDQIYQARLRELSDAADPASRTFAARYVLEGEAASAPLGSTVTIELLVRQNSGNRAVLVPIGAIHDRGTGPGVWVVDDKSEVKFRSVTIASVGQEQAVLSGGIQAGEKVVALGAHLLHEGQVVNMPNEEKKEKASYAKF